MEKFNNASISEIDIADEKVFVEKIWEELLQGVIWEFCFDVHRAAKLSYLFLDPALDPNVDLEKEKNLEQSEETEKNASDQKAKSKNDTYLCPNCKKSYTAHAIEKHFLKCLGIKEERGSRVPSRKIADGKDEIDDDNKSTSSLGRRNEKQNFYAREVIKATKKSHGKKQSQKAKVHGSSSKTSLENINIEDMTCEERRQFFKQKCGVVTKANKMCMNSHKCTQHRDEEKREIRHCLLSDMCEQLISDGQIDVDTVDKRNCGFFFS